MCNAHDEFSRNRRCGAGSEYMLATHRRSALALAGHICLIAALKAEVAERE